MILFSGHGARCRGVRVGFGTWAMVALVCGGLIPGAAFYAGMHTDTDSSRIPVAVVPAVTTPIPSAVAAHGVGVLPEQVIEARVEQRLEQQLSAIAPRLAHLQAQAARLDAIANRLVKVNGADPEEFGLGSGGPESSDARTYTAVEFKSALAALSNSFQSQQALFEGLDQLLAKRRLEAEITPSGWPVDGGWVSSRFGKRSDPVNGKRAFHHGIDIAAKRYTPINTVAAGIVSFAGTRSGYGRVVEITHGNGYTSVYAHNQRNKVKVGERVKKGQTIALVGSSGRATGPHLHFEVRQHGKSINPGTFLRASR